jgi:putative transcriptional regulator
MNTLKGQFLIASPYLPDANFYRSVVLLVQHDENGALGLVLNRPTNQPLSEIWAKITNVPCDADMPVFVGGPCEGPLMAVHELAEYSEEEICEGVNFASQRDNLLAIVAQAERDYRVFSGYSGWGGGQLEAELRAGGWLTGPATSELVFADSEQLWRDVVQDIGDEILLDSLGIQHRPEDPSLN